MALINCPECNKEVSDKAATCPSCGVTIAQHIEMEKHEKKLTTTQLTGKSLKLQSALSGIIFAIGFFMSLSPESQSGGLAGISLHVLLMFFGFVWWVTTRIRIWWNHE